MNTLYTKEALELSDAEQERKSGPSELLCTYSREGGVAQSVCCTVDEGEEFQRASGLPLDSDELTPEVYGRLAGWLALYCELETPAPDTVRAMLPHELVDRGIERADYKPTDHPWLALWADRSGYYFENFANVGKDAPRLWAYVGNDTASFATAEEAQAWLWARVEVQS